MGKALRPWWKVQTTDDENRKSVEEIRSSGAGSQNYFVLVILSTLIAAYGLVSDSTATVIGAMIVAPLMGPILGLALGVVRSDSRTFYRSLWAASLGVLLVVLTSLVVAFLVGPENIDYLVREIAGRTRPTLYDMAIGVTAGLAGAYCCVNARLQASIAGVAVAVALVPPLGVTGLTLAGAFNGYAAWGSVLGSFMLFFANFLTIEVAAVVVFLLAGIGEVHLLIGKKGFLRHFSLQFVLLLATGIFLTQQLHLLVRERQYQRIVRRVVTEELRRIPGANLDGLEVTLSPDGKVLHAIAVVSSRKEIRPGDVRAIQDQVNAGLEEQDERADALLVIRAAASVYVSPTGFLYVPPASPLDPKLVRLQRFESALTEGLKSFPNMELESFREVASAQKGTTELLVTLVSPYAAEPRVVAAYQKRVNEILAGQQGGPGPVALTVRSLIIRSADATSEVQYSAPEIRTGEELAGSPGEREQKKLEQRVLEELKELVQQDSGARVLEAQLREVTDLTSTRDPKAGIQLFRVRAVVEAPQLYRYTQVVELQGRLSRELSTAEKEIVVQLTVENRVGTTIQPAELSEELQQDRTALITRKLRALTGTLDGARLMSVDSVVLKRPSGDEGKGLVVVTASILSPRSLTGKTIESWQGSLGRTLQLKGDNFDVRLTVLNQVGRAVTEESP